MLRFLYLVATEIPSSTKILCVDIKIKLLFHMWLLMNVSNHMTPEDPAHKMTISNKNIST